VYGYLAPSLEMPASQESDRISILHLVGRMITVVQNGQTIIDDQEIAGITGVALDSELPGPIYLRGGGCDLFCDR
jgi:hypothetical protein